MLREHRASQSENRRLFGPDYRDDLNLVFATPEGDYLKPDSYLCFEAGIGQGPLLARMMSKLPEYSSVQLEFEPATQTPVIIAKTSS